MIRYSTLFVIIFSVISLILVKSQTIQPKSESPNDEPSTVPLQPLIPEPNSTQSSDPQPSPGPQPSEPQPGPQPSTPQPGPQPSTPQPGPQPSTPQPGPQPSTPQPGPQPSTPQPSGPKPGPQPSTPQPGPQPSTPQPGPQPSTPQPSGPKPGPQPSTPQPGPQPGPSTPQPGPQPSTPQPGPQPSTPQPGPQPSTPQPGPQPSTPQPGPQPGPQPSEPQPGPQPSEPQPGPQPSEPQPGPQPSEPQPGPQPSEPQPGPQPSEPQPGPQPSEPQPGPQPSEPQPGPQPSEPQPGPQPSEPQPGPQPSEPQPGPQPSEPQPGPQPSEPQPGPQPSTPEPGPQPSTPQPGPQPSTPEPGPQPSTPEPGPQPSTPEPGPQPTPNPEPPLPTLDFYSSILAISTYSPSIDGGIAFTGEYLFFFGVETKEGISNTSFGYNLRENKWFNYSYWDSDNMIISYSQPPTYDSIIHPTYFYWVEQKNFISHYSMFNGENFTDLYKEEGPILNERVIAATTNGTVFIYGSTVDPSIWVLKNSTITKITPTSGRYPYPRVTPALVGYENGFLMHGGKIGGVNFTGELWHFNYTDQTWNLLNENLIYGSGHKILLSYLGSSPIIYFTGFDLYGSIYVYDVHENEIYGLPGNQHVGGYGSLTVLTRNRILSYGGNITTTSQNYTTTNITNKLEQFVDQRYCTSVAACSSCTTLFGCGWCTNPLSNSPACIAGTYGPFVNTTCTVSSFLNQVSTCPPLVDRIQEIESAWIVLFCMLIMGAINFACIKYRSSRSSTGYVVVKS